MRMGAVVSMVVIGLAASAVAFALAFFVPWLPDQASEQRERIDFVFWLTTVICIGIFGIVVSIILYSVWKFRARPDDDTDGLPIHGHTGIEIVWTAVPFVLVVAISIASGVALARNEEKGDQPLRVEVTARQFAWLFEYPNGTATGTLRLPLERTTVLRLVAHDVLHSFWVPEFGQKQDAVPGIETELVITPTRLGRFDVICTELCGLGHALMRTSAVVMQPAAFERWLAQAGREQEGPPGQAGASLFAENGCGGCHAFAPANATGRTGPPLDDLAARAEALGRQPEEFVRESIVDPDAVVAEGFPAGVMPKTYGELPDEQVDALVQYLLGANEGG